MKSVLSLLFLAFVLATRSALADTVAVSDTAPSDEVVIQQLAFDSRSWEVANTQTPFFRGIGEDFTVPAGGFTLDKITMGGFNATVALSGEAMRLNLFQVGAQSAETGMFNIQPTYVANLPALAAGQKWITFDVPNLALTAGDHWVFEISFNDPTNNPSTTVNYNGSGYDFGRVFQTRTPTEYTTELHGENDDLAFVIHAVPVPEPTALVLGGMGVLGFGRFCRRYRRS